MSQAFISYHRSQSKLARLIAHRVAADGHSVWWDRSDRPGDQWSEAVATALANSACVIVIWSKQAVASSIIMGEATAGYGREALVSVMADKTPVPSPFDRAPVIDMHDWEGESADLAWIRLREPLRAKLQAAERQAAENAPLPPARPQPVRVGFSSAAAPPLVTSYEEPKRGSPTGAIMTLLMLGGLGAAGWTYRDDLQVRAEALRLALTTPPPAPVATAPIPPPAAPAEVAAPAPTETAALIPIPSSEPVASDSAPAAVQPVAAGRRDLDPVPQMTVTYEQWRDGAYQPQAPRTAPARPAPPAPVAAERASASAMVIPAPPPTLAPVSVSPAARFVSIRQGQAMDIDGGAVRESDVWFAPDRTGYGLFLGFTNGARARAVRASKATRAGCEDVVLRRSPISARELGGDVGLCLRSSDGTLSAWRVERIDRDSTGATLHLRPVG